MSAVYDIGFTDVASYMVGLTASVVEGHVYVCNGQYLQDSNSTGSSTFYSYPRYPTYSTI